MGAELLCESDLPALSEPASNLGWRVSWMTEAGFFGGPRGAEELGSLRAFERHSAYVSPPPRPQPRTTWAGSFPDAPPPCPPLAASAPVGTPPLRAPQMSGLSCHGAPPPPPPLPPPPTPRANVTDYPPQPPLRWGSRWWFACCVAPVSCPCAY